MKSTCALVLASSLLVLACDTEPPAKQVEEAEQADAGSADKAADKSAAEANALTPEELELIAADPKTLTPDQNRKRAYALRKKIMQDPDSPQAKQLESMRQAALNGELDGQLPGAKKPEDEGMVIPAPPYLRSDEQAVSHDEPVDPEAEPPAPTE